jgi:DNA polymerase delta subunit 2
MIGQFEMLNSQIERKSSEIEESKKFKNLNFTEKQYNSLYTTRLDLLSARILPKQEWKEPAKSDISSIDSKAISFLIGTIYKDMLLKPNILDEITREKWITAPPPRNNYTSENDSIVLEDLTGRVILRGDVLDKLLLVTGMVVGVFGKESIDGSYFHVIDITFPKLIPRDLQNPREPTKLAFISGLEISTSIDLSYSLLADYLCGDSGLDIDQVSQIQRLIICGNSLAQPSEQDVEKRMIKNKFGSLTLQVLTPILTL